MQNVFGSGILWGIQNTDANGNLVANPTPIIFGTLQDVSIDTSFDTKMLYGQNQFPVAIGRGKGKISCKASFANIQGDMIGNLLFGQSITNGILSAVYDTTGAVIPDTTYEITPTVPGSGTFSRDLGVINATTGQPLKLVASAPTTGQYMVADGVYTFAAADVGTKVFISFEYTSTSTTAKQQTVQNVTMGYAPTFRADLYMPYNGKSLIFTLPNCLSSKFSLSTKLDDFAIPEFDFDAFADASGNVMTWSSTE